MLSMFIHIDCSFLFYFFILGFGVIVNRVEVDAHLGECTVGMFSHWIDIPWLTACLQTVNWLESSRLDRRETASPEGVGRSLDPKTGPSLGSTGMEGQEY